MPSELLKYLMVVFSNSHIPSKKLLEPHSNVRFESFEQDCRVCPLAGSGDKYLFVSVSCSTSLQYRASFPSFSIYSISNIVTAVQLLYYSTVDQFCARA